MTKQPEPIERKLREARVARLATVDSTGHPQVLPVCFVYDGSGFYTAVDRKPKRVPPSALGRLRHIQADARVSLLIDEFNEDWSRLWYILVRGKAELVTEDKGNERAKVLELLKEKYPPYRKGLLPEDAPLVRITPERFTAWGSF